MALPASTFFTSDDAQDEGTVRQGLDDLLEGVIRLAGSSSEGAPVISSGAITPSYGTIRVDTEAAAATDDLTTINQTNIADKCFLWMRCVDNAREVVVKHTTSGTGHIELSDSLDLTLNRVTQWLILQRQGTKWVEVMRSGREKTHELDAAGEPTLSGTWSQASGIAFKFWKDETGTVKFQGAVTSSASLVSGSIETLSSALPAGYRPGAVREFFAPDTSGLGSDVHITVNTSGVLQISNYGTTLTSAQNVYLDGISYRAEA